MKTQDEIRAGKIRSNHNITVHGTAGSGAKLRDHGGRHSCRFDECAIVGILRAVRPSADAAREAQGFGQRLSQHRRARIPCGCCEERRITMKLQTRIKAGRPDPNHNTIVR